MNGRPVLSARGSIGNGFPGMCPPTLHLHICAKYEDRMRAQSSRPQQPLIGDVPCVGCSDVRKLSPSRQFGTTRRHLFSRPSGGPRQQGSSPKIMEIWISFGVRN